MGKHADAGGEEKAGKSFWNRVNQRIARWSRDPTIAALIPLAPLVLVICAIGLMVTTNVRVDFIVRDTDGPRPAPSHFEQNVSVEFYQRDDGETVLVREHRFFVDGRLTDVKLDEIGVMTRYPHEVDGFTQMAMHPAPIPVPKRWHDRYTPLDQRWDMP